VAEPLRLSLVLGSYPHVAGLEAPEGVVFERQPVASLQDAFKCMCREVCFDVCEMSITGYLLARRHGVPFTALPVFPVRGFPQSHASMVVNRDAGISTPRDLEGKRVGARAYTGTASLWVRGMLQEEHGVDLDRVTWVSAEEEHVPRYQADAPANVSYELGCDLKAMLASGDLAAGIGVSAARQEHLVPLIPNARNAAVSFYWRTGVLQINHVIVVRDELLAAHEGLGRALYDAFDGAKRRWLATSPDVPLADELALPQRDPVPYGVEANAASIAALLRYAQAQDLTETPMGVEQALPQL
jgi:4,5-dihydroxyphthalate decarboxylase